MFFFMFDFLGLVPTQEDAERLALHQLALREGRLRTRVLQEAYADWSGEYLPREKAEQLDRELAACAAPVPVWLRSYLRRRAPEFFPRRTRLMAPAPWSRTL